MALSMSSIMLSVDPLITIVAIGLSFLSTTEKEKNISIHTLTNLKIEAHPFSNCLFTIVGKIDIENPQCSGQHLTQDGG